MENYTWELDNYEKSFFDGHFLNHISYQPTGEPENIQKKRIKRLYINGNTALFKAIYTLSRSNENYELLVYVEYDNYDKQAASYTITKEDDSILFFDNGDIKYFDLPQTVEEIRSIVKLVLREYDYNLISEIKRSQDGKKTLVYNWVFDERDNKAKIIQRKYLERYYRPDGPGYLKTLESWKTHSSSFGKMKNKSIEKDIIYLRSIT